MPDTAANALPVATASCPGLSISPQGVRWVDSLGAEHDLMREERMSPGELALVAKRSPEWILRLIRAGELYPVLRINPRTLEVWRCSYDDYLVRSLCNERKESA